MAKQSSDSFSDHQLKQIRGVFNEGINELVVPQFDDVNKRLNKIGEALEDHTDRLSRIEQRMENDTTRLDNYDRRISTLEKMT